MSSETWAKIFVLGESIVKILSFSTESLFILQRSVLQQSFPVSCSVCSCLSWVVPSYIHSLPSKIQLPPRGQKLVIFLFSSFRSIFRNRMRKPSSTVLWKECFAKCLWTVVTSLKVGLDVCMCYEFECLWHIYTNSKLV